MVRVYINPTYTRPDEGDGGIRRVTEAMHRYLPEFGVEPTMSPDEADVINNHGASLESRPGVPEVASCHGLYWDNHEWATWAHEVNAQVVNVLSRAVAHTAPSAWVSAAMRRGMFVYPEVVHHGVDAQEWEPGASGGYVLWDKARKDMVSDPADMNRVAAMLPSLRFVSTFGDATANVRNTGRLTLDGLRPIKCAAGVYLATARETFGIGTLEALAAGVPVAGWDWGGQSEIVAQGETGYLAPPGDYQALAACINRCVAERARLSANARADALARWAWRPRIAQYAEIFKRVHAERLAPCPRVSVVVTCHDLARFLPDALGSILAQTVADWECVIVDDASSDNTPAVALEWQARDSRFRYERTPENLKLPGALNFGWQRARGRYVLNLDADNVLDPLALETLAGALDKDSGIHIAYGHLDMTGHDLSGRRRGTWPYPDFSWRGQMGHLNQIPSTAMVRREVYERSGGYRARMWRAEDAEFWARATSFGFRAKKVTELAVFTYRDRSDSKSKSEDGDGNWVAWMPWGFAATGREGAERVRDGKGPRVDFVPWGAQGPTPPGLRFWPVPDCTRPLVSVIIPCGTGHEKYLLDALDSLVAQTFRDWEAIVVFDTHAAPKEISGAPYARVLHTEGGRGPGRARNLGTKSARGEVLYFLDADDYILPQTLEKMVAAYKETGGYLVYGDWLRNDQNGADLLHYEAEDFRCGAALRKMQHSTNMLVSRSAHEKIGGFDEAMAGWEDWDYCIAMQAIAGLCSARIPEPLFVYRFRAGQRRESSFGDGKKLKEYIRQKWARFYEGKEEMSCGCKKAGQPAGSNGNGGGAKALIGGPVLAAAKQGGMAAVEYLGSDSGPFTVQGRATGSYYRFGTDAEHRVRPVRAEDAAEMVERSKFGRRQYALVEVADTSRATTVATATMEEFLQVAPIRSESTAATWPEIEDSDVVADDSTGVTIEALSASLPAEDSPQLGAAHPVGLVPDVKTMSSREIRDAIPASTRETLLAWLTQERASPSPRKSVIASINRALSAAEERVGTR